MLAQTHFLRLDRLHVLAPTGAAVRREAVRHPGAVAMVPVVGDAIVLLRQYRAPVDAEMLELPAGKLDVDGEDPAAAAERELAEEVGLVPGRLELVAEFYTGPGFTDERMHVFVATDCRPVARSPHGPEEEAAEVVLVPLDDVPEMIAEGRIEDAKTLVGLLALLRSR